MSEASGKWRNQGNACPDGWHLPSVDEWDELINFVGDDANTKLKSSTEWDKNGTDTFGFSVLPLGYKSENSLYRKAAYFWTSTKNGFHDPYYYRIGSDQISSDNVLGPNKRLSVRCIKNSR